MITTIRITNREEAKTAIDMITAYLGVTETKEATPTKEVTKEKKTVEAPVEDDENVKSASEISLADLTETAKAAVAKTKDRALVKATINVYGANLAAVKENDYPALFADLKGL